MGRLKKDHTGWRTSGLWIKYQEPSINDAPKKIKGKKDTRRWCGGKKGREHDFYRYYYRLWSGKYSDWIRMSCRVCHKEFYHGEKHPEIPLVIPVSDEYDSGTPVQVKVNGNALPIDPARYGIFGEWCEWCKEYHTN